MVDVEILGKTIFLLTNQHQIPAIEIRKVVMNQPNIISKGANLFGDMAI